MGYSKTIISLERNMANSMKNGKGVRIKYQTPCLFDLGSGIAYGVCVAGGSPASDPCGSGQTPGAKCQSGGIAPGGKCQTGDISGEQCRGGGSAATNCGGGGNRGG